MDNLPVVFDHNGKQAVSARELYEALEFDLKNYKRWINKNITNSKFAIENEDFTSLVLMKSESKRGNFAQDYALSIDFAKRLSMMARTEAGEKIRKYFIECERKVVEAPKLSPAELLLEQAKMLVAQERRLTNVEVALDSLVKTKELASQQLLAIDRSSEQMPHETTRNKIRRIVNHYVNSTGSSWSDIYRMIYDRLYYRYHINLRAVNKYKSETLLDVAERLGHIDKIFIIVSNELR